MSSALKQAVPKLKNASRLLTTLMGTSQRKKVDPKSLTPMIYPYTLTAKAIQFPWVYFYKNAWWWRYYLYAWIVTSPLWFYITTKGESHLQSRRSCCNNIVFLSQSTPRKQSLPGKRRTNWTSRKNTSRNGSTFNLFEVSNGICVCLEDLVVVK